MQILNQQQVKFVVPSPFPSAVCRSDSYIVRVKAVVMTRDDCGWLAQDGCLSRVGVCRLLPTELLGRNTFLIHGERLKDRQVGAAAGRRHLDASFCPRVRYFCLRCSSGSISEKFNGLPDQSASFMDEEAGGTRARS